MEAVIRKHERIDNFECSIRDELTIRPFRVIFIDKKFKECRFKFDNAVCYTRNQWNVLADMRDTITELEIKLANTE